MEQELVSFGNYLLKRYGVMIYSNDGRNIPLYEREVSDADLSNWREDNPQKEDGGNNFTATFKHGDKVKVFLMPEAYSEFPGLVAHVTGVHFFLGKVKYDLELRFAGEFSTRIYNIDSILVQAI
jgi:hypothetical protein